MSEIFDDMNMDVRKGKEFVQCSCFAALAFIFLGITYTHYGGVWGCVYVVVLTITAVFLCEENVAHKYFSFGKRFSVVAVVFFFTIFFGGLVLAPMAVIMIAMLAAIEFIYKVWEDTQDTVKRLVTDVEFLYDENAAADNDD